MAWLRLENSLSNSNSKSCSVDWLCLLEKHLITLGVGDWECSWCLSECVGIWIHWWCFFSLVDDDDDDDDGICIQLKRADIVSF